MRFILSPSLIAIGLSHEHLLSATRPSCAPATSPLECRPETNTHFYIVPNFFRMGNDDAYARDMQGNRNQLGISDVKRGEIYPIARTPPDPFFRSFLSPWSHHKFKRYSLPPPFLPTLPCGPPFCPPFFLAQFSDSGCKYGILDRGYPPLVPWCLVRWAAQLKEGWSSVRVLLSDFIGRREKSVGSLN